MFNLTLKALRHIKQDFVLLQICINAMYDYLLSLLNLTFYNLVHIHNSKLRLNTMTNNLLALPACLWTVGGTRSKPTQTQKVPGLPGNRTLHFLPAGLTPRLYY